MTWPYRFNTLYRRQKKNLVKKLFCLLDGFLMPDISSINSNASAPSSGGSPPPLPVAVPLGNVGGHNIVVVNNAVAAHPEGAQWDSVERHGESFFNQALRGATGQPPSNREAIIAAANARYAAEAAQLSTEAQG